MKNLIALIILAAICSCKKEDDLPPRHRDMFECEIDGKYWKTSNEGANLQCQDIETIYYPTSANGIDSGFIAVMGSDCSTLNGVSFSLLSVLEGETIDFANDERVVSCVFQNWEDFNGFDLINFDSIQSGELLITKLRAPVIKDEISPGGQPYKSYTPGLAEGQFEMILYNSTGVKVEVTNGRFSVQL